MAEVTMVLKVDLHCCKCYKKVKKVLCKFPEIRDQVYDEKQNTVTIKVVTYCPERLMQKIRCKGCKSIKCIEIKPPPKPDEEKPKNPKSDKPQEKPKEESPPPPCCSKCPKKCCPKKCCRPPPPTPPPKPPPSPPPPCCCSKCPKSCDRPCYPNYPFMVCCTVCYGMHGGGSCPQPSCGRPMWYDCGRPVYDSWCGDGGNPSICSVM